jgi:hypothetical protein
MACCHARWRCCGRCPAPPYPDHTLVDQAVTAARQRTPAAAGFINAVLRRFVRERDALVAAARARRSAPTTTRLVDRAAAPGLANASGRRCWLGQPAAADGAARERPPQHRARLRAAAGRAGLRGQLLDGRRPARPWCWPSPAR